MWKKIFNFIKIVLIIILIIPSLISLILLPSLLDAFARSLDLITLIIFVFNLMPILFLIYYFFNIRKVKANFYMVIFILIILHLSISFILIFPVDCQINSYFVTNKFTSGCSVYTGCDDKRFFEEYNCNLSRPELIKVVKRGSQFYDNCKTICKDSRLSFCAYYTIISNITFYCPEVSTCPRDNCT
jgi:hypothetical protein